MTEDEFWLIVDSARADAKGDIDAQREAIEAALLPMPPADILAFQAHFDRLHALSYNEKLWGAAYVMNGGCSDDGFDYFRGWLIAQGQRAFHNALKNPDGLADLVGDEPEPDGYEFEDMLSVALSPWMTATGADLNAFYTALGALPRPTRPELAAFSWSEDDDSLAQQFPRLSAKFT